MYNSKSKRKGIRRKMRQAKDRFYERKKVISCAYCEKPLKRPDATIDHVKPLSRGGYNRMKNFTIACARCNKQKGRRDAGEFLKAKRAIKATIGVANGR